MAIPKNIISENPGLGKWAIMVGYRGSIAHGMYVPQNDPASIDDKDIMAVCIPPLDYYFGLREFGSRGTKEIMVGEWDIVIYELKKLVGMLCQGNPNVLSMLWLDDSLYIKITALGKMLRENRSLFVGRHVYRSFTGYAYGQLHRMEHGAFNGYMGAKRKGLVEKFGYDCKNAAHLIRLLRMGIEFLKDGELYVKREDAPQLLDIKRGEWTLEQVKAESTRLFQLSEEAYIKSQLPKNVNMEKVNEMLTDMIWSAHVGRIDK